MQSSQGFHIRLSTLPFDLKCRILQEAAKLEQTAAPHLVLISKHVRPWIDQVLYHSVILDSPDAVALFANCIVLRRDDAFFARTVKLLCISTLLRSEEIVSEQLQDLSLIISHCTNVSKLALWVNSVRRYPPYLHQVAIRDLGALTHLSLVYLTPEDIQELPHSLTHLNITYNDKLHLDLTSWRDLLKRCPALTHLIIEVEPCLPMQMKMSEIIQRILSLAPRLELLLLELEAGATSAELWEDLRHISLGDHRFVVLCDDEDFANAVQGSAEYERFHHPVNDWSRLYPDKLTVWEYAESFRDERKNACSES